MAKRTQINVTLEDSELSDINEFFRVHGMTPQGLLKAGARKFIEEDILGRKADMQTIKSWKEIERGLSKPIDDLLEIIEAGR